MDRPVTSNEIESIIFNNSLKSSPGPEGFTAVSTELLFPVVLGLRCCLWVFSGCGPWAHSGCSSVVAAWGLVALQHVGSY